jgi:DNA polymerase III epsilon subunit-like protein
MAEPADLATALPPSRPETFVSVDIETAGPTPGRYAMLSIGACLVDAPEHGFYVELKPTGTAVVDSAQAIGGLSLETLARDGVDPAEAMKRLEDWLAAEVGEGTVPVFVGFNAAFDWQFVNWYFHEFAAEEMGENPFGFAPLDLKALIAGRLGCAWEDTKMSRLPKWLNRDGPLTHDALDDAIQQAAIFRRLMVGPPPENWWQWLRRPSYAIPRR